LSFKVSAAVAGAMFWGGAAAAGPQYVIISFDGAQHVEQWERSRALASRTGAEFTYFLSCVYLLSPENKGVYQAPHHRAGRSNVGFAPSKEDVAARLQQIWAARAEGHEIASHACGHFDGKDWTRQDWLAEFDAFRSILRDAWAVNGIADEPDGWKAFVDHEFLGFRAPYLSESPALSQALAERGFHYNASGVSRGPVLPNFDRVVQFSLPMIPEGPKSRRVIAMDYNLYVRHSRGVEQPEQAAEYAGRAVAAFQAAFDEQYQGKRIPLQVGFHFTLMNDGAYWNALETFASDVCLRPEVRCVSYRRYLDETGPKD
jgi:peptidoglycan/xylan/chitin deacetylase (PgdA/CDA1 family)